jgi:hypothetical protein
LLAVLKFSCSTLILTIWHSDVMVDR